MNAKRSTIVTTTQVLNGQVHYRTWLEDNDGLEVEVFTEGATDTASEANAAVVAALTEVMPRMGLVHDEDTICPECHDEALSLNSTHNLCPSCRDELVCRCDGCNSCGDGCGERNDNGEGFDGLCGNCADVAEGERED